MMVRSDPLDWLESAYRLEIDTDTRDRHLAVVTAAIRSAPPTRVAPGFALRRRVAAVAAALLAVVAPVGIAVAAEDSVPGDFLYPVKQVTERVRGFADRDLVATHRVEEVERLLFERAPRAEIARAFERAEIAAAQLADPNTLDTRLERVRERIRRQEELEESAVPQPGSERDGTEPDPAGPESNRPGEPGPQDDPGQVQDGGRDPDPIPGNAESRGEGGGSGTPATTGPAPDERPGGGTSDTAPSSDGPPGGDESRDADQSQGDPGSVDRERTGTGGA
jgi:hypothetical protein